MVLQKWGYVLGKGVETLVVSLREEVVICRRRFGGLQDGGGGSFGGRERGWRCGHVR
jgi:hypothetical protein